MGQRGNQESLKEECSIASNVAKTIRKKDKGELSMDIVKGELFMILFQRWDGAETRMQWTEE